MINYKRGELVIDHKKTLWGHTTWLIFSESKTIALIQEIYKGAGVKTMNYTKLIKILYLCDRQMYKNL